MTFPEKAGQPLIYCMACTDLLLESQSENSNRTN